MKQFIRKFFAAAMLLSMTFAFSSCEGSLDDVFGQWDRPSGNVTVQAESNKYYVWNGSELVLTVIPTDFIDFSTLSGLTIPEGKYIVKGNITLTGTVSFSGNVELILSDGATLTLNGIISASDNKLTISGQENNTGKFIVNGTDDVSNVVELAGLEVNGGEITVKGGNGATVGSNAIKATVTMRGGTVNATGGNGTTGDGGCGITESSTVIYYGGKIVATGGLKGTSGTDGLGLAYSGLATGPGGNLQNNAGKSLSYEQKATSTTATWTTNSVADGNLAVNLSYYTVRIPKE